MFLTEIEGQPELFYQGANYHLNDLGAYLTNEIFVLQVIRLGGESSRFKAAYRAKSEPHSGSSSWKPLPKGSGYVTFKLTAGKEGGEGSKVCRLESRSA